MGSIKFTTVVVRIWVEWIKFGDWSSAYAGKFTDETIATVTLH